MSWALRRQFQYMFGLFFFAVLIVFIIVYPSISKPATCFDGKQNGTEKGVDCGGVCNRICNSMASEPVILWSRAFNVTGSTYNLLAYVENHNQNAAIEHVSYKFMVYDTNNILIGTREGTTFVPPNQQFAVFEPRFDGGASEVKTVAFQFTSPFIWVKKAPTVAALPIKIDKIIYGDDTLSPRLEARINNESIYELPSFDVITILYDVDHNAIQVSKTALEGLSSNTSVPLLFTWAHPFVGTIATQDILPQINPFSVSF
jgi:hypothetical protein